jgi:hypothetical protein
MTPAPATSRRIRPGRPNAVHDGQERGHLFRVRRFGQRRDRRGPTATYHLSVSVHPAANQGVNCTTYTSTNVPQTIGPGTGLVSSTITVPGNPRIADVDVKLVLNHALMQDIDAHLRSPAGNDNGLFTDIGAAAVGGADLRLDLRRRGWRHLHRGRQRQHLAGALRHRSGVCADRLSRSVPSARSACW